MSPSIILEKSWDIARPSAESKRLSDRLSIPVEVANYLTDCGIETEEAARQHLNPELKSINTPWLLKDMDKAVSRLITAIEKRETIGIFGDYDADGVSASALLSLFLREIGQPHEVYIPHREGEGYGLNPIGLNWLRSRGASLIVTVDCGITGWQEVELAKSMGLDIIITDHHEPSQRLPDCTAVIDPKQGDCSYPFDGLAGVGVAFNLIIALRTALREKGFFKRIKEPCLKDFLDIVTIGTVGDVVPLLYENRIFTKKGLAVMQDSVRPGIKALISECVIRGELGVGEVAFKIVPRINAAGRIEHAKIALQLLLTTGDDKAKGLASTLTEFNYERQRIEALIFNEAMKMAEKEEKIAPILVLKGDTWKKGVIGIVASKLTDRFRRPVILLTREKGEFLEGSGRSIDSIDLYGLLCSCSQFLENFGGHKAAAGLKLKEENFEAFKETAIDYINGLKLSKHSPLKIYMDVDVGMLLRPEISSVFYSLEPYGPGCDPPLIRIKDFRIKNMGIVGNNHLKLLIASNNPLYHGTIEVMGWGYGDYEELPWKELELLCTPCFSSWNGERTLQLRLKDVRYANGDNEKQ